MSALSTAHAISGVRWGRGLVVKSASTACKRLQVFLSFRKLKSNTKDCRNPNQSKTEPLDAAGRLTVAMRRYDRADRADAPTYSRIYAHRFNSSWPVSLLLCKLIVSARLNISLNGFQFSSICLLALMFMKEKKSWCRRSLMCIFSSYISTVPLGKSIWRHYGVYFTWHYFEFSKLYIDYTPNSHRVSVFCLRRSFCNYSDAIACHITVRVTCTQNEMGRHSIDDGETDEDQNWNQWT